MLSIDSVNLPSARKGVLVLLVGLALAGYGAYDYQQQSDAVADAVSVEATVTEVGVEPVSTGSGSSTDVDYRPVVEFDYEFEGTSYTGTSVFPSSVAPTYDTESAARDVVADYEAGATATAYVDPSSPSDGFLRDEPSKAPLDLLVVAAAAILLGGASVVSSLRA